jgi:A/G-specific adenine glycosylase
LTLAVLAQAGAPASRFSRAVIEWQRRSGRHDLPWQQTREPYHIWLSEVMLQQTQVSTVIPYFRRFLEAFPDLRSLAVAPVDDVLARWSGLGYYSRAHHLHRAAGTVLQQHAGTLPRSREALEALPGIGRSTAAAIRVFAFGQRDAILDGNVKRVLARVLGIEGYPGDPAVARQLWAAAETLLPTRDLRAYTQGLMDLGAIICTRSRPACSDCPLKALCVARRSRRIAELPGRRPRRLLPHRQVHVLVLIHRKCILLERRPESGVWGGLWSLPEGESVSAAPVAGRCRWRLAEDLAPVRHAFTHFTLDILPHRYEAGSVKSPAPLPGARWVSKTDALTMGLPTPVRRLITDLFFDN